MSYYVRIFTCQQMFSPQFFKESLTNVSGIALAISNSALTLFVSSFDHGSTSVSVLSVKCKG